ncbi:MAG: hypothetical protein HY738_21165, partial [Bacteroidia bacterium]|nr:hypothetical protein [Bacteroidia bacterium]
MKKNKLSATKGKIPPPISLIISGLTIYVMTFFFNGAFAQTGEKFATGGNNLAEGDFLGSKNNAALLIKTNNTARGIITPKGFWGIGTKMPGYPLDVAGRAHFSRNTYMDSTLFALNIEIALLTKTASLLVLQNAVVNGIVTIGNVLTLDGAAGSITSATGSVSFQDDNLVTTGAVAIGCLSPASGYKLDVNGAAKLLGPLTIGSSTVIDGNTDQIRSTSGVINFGNTNITTGGSITAANIISTGANQFNNLYVSHNLEVGSNIKCLGEYNGNKIFANQISIGVQNPQAPLDVQGDAIIRGWLYVQDGVVVGKRFKGGSAEVDTIKPREPGTKEVVIQEVKSEKMVSDTMKTTEMEISKARIYETWSEKMETYRIIADTVETQKMELEQLTADTMYSSKVQTDKIETTQEVKVGNEIKIDGTNGTITANKVNANNMVISGQTNLSQLHITDSIKIGNSVWIGGINSDIPASYNHIYSDDGYLSVQCKKFDYNTIINAYNNGKVGIGTYNPHEKLDIDGNLRIRNGDIYLKDYASLNHGLGWYGTGKLFAGQDINGPVLYGFNGGALGIRIGTNQESVALRWTGEGNVGIGTETPGAKLHVFNGNIINGSSDFILGIDDDRPQGVKHGNRALVHDGYGTGTEQKDLLAI